MAKKKKPGFWERFALKELSRIRNVQDGNELFLLSEDELAELKKIRNATYIKASLAGVLGVVFLFAPYHFFGETLFPKYQIWIPVYKNYLPVEISFIVYSLVLVLIEIWYLTYLNIKTVAAIAKTCGHPNPNDPNYEHNINALIAVGLERKQKELESIGINPYEGLNPFGLFIFQMILRLKATVSGILFKLIVKKALGRYALRAIVDFAGMPIYAFWNAWGARKIMYETRVRVMAPPLIKRCADLLYEEQKENPEFNKVIYDTLQLISESKRDFHYNHFLLGITVLEKFGIVIKEEPPYNDDFIQEIATFSAKTQAGFQRLFIFGIMIDGHLSKREIKAIHYLIEKKVITYSEGEIKQWSNDYFAGKGIEGFWGNKAD